MKRSALAGCLSNELLRKAVESSDIPVLQVAKRAEMDGSQLRRTLGLDPYYRIREGRRMGPYWRKSMTPHNALRIAKALYLDPVDIGL
jgi:hypothetical protein